MATADLMAPSGHGSAAAMLSQQKGPVKVEAKEVEEITLLRRRIGMARLDMGPFLVAYAMITLALVYHAAVGQWRVFTLLSYALGATGAAHVLTLLFTVWSVDWKAFVQCRRVALLSEAELVKVVPAKFSGNKETVPLSVRVLRADAAAASGLPVPGASKESEEVVEVSFEFRKLRFVYHPDTCTFTRLKFPVHEPFSTYLRASGYGSPERVLAAADVWGLNKFEVPVPPFLGLLWEHMLAPFFVFQIFCVGLWCLDEYWYYSLFTLFMLVMFECTVVGQRLRTLRELRSLQTPKQKLQTYRNGKWDLVPGEALLPGDVISIGRPHGEGNEDKVVPADCLLLAGTCIAEEAVLTGESTPQWKAPVSDAGVSPSEHLHIKAHKHHVLFGGTKILQHTGDKTARLKTPDGGCLAIVLRTGFETSQGQLMRTILYSSERVTAGSADAAVFICFLLVFAVSAAYYVLKNGLADPKRDRFKLLLNCVMIITSVIPPELPMELTIAVNASLVALARKRVFCTEPFRIPFAGKVEVCCFDKTGTLTTDHLLLEGIAAAPGTEEALAAERERAASAPPPAAGAAAAAAPSRRPRTSRRAGGAPAPAATPALAGSEGLVRDPALLPAAVTEVLATCQSLVIVDGELIGDPLEKAALQACRWSYSGDVALSPDRKIKATVQQRYHFSSALRRMSAIVCIEDEAAPGASYIAVLKGAPEMVRGFLAQVPGDYDATYKRFAAQGARVIALARRALPAGLEGPELRHMAREDVEAQMEFMGFAVFQCPLKPESEPALAALAASSHMLVMITGDAPLTACHAAAQVHIVQRPALVLQHREEAHDKEAVARHAPGSAEADAEFEWVAPDESDRRPFSRHWRDILLLASEHDLCLAGDALAHVEAAGLGAKVIPLVQVFARTSPEQKETILRTLRAAGRCTLMVGDGTNDVGALKAAHVGVALLAAPPPAPASGPQGGDKRAGAGGDKRRKGAAAAAGSSAVVAAGGGGGAAAGGVELPERKQKSGKAGPPAKLPPGSAMLEEMRKQGKPISPALERWAAWMDKMHEESTAGGDTNLVKPGDASMAAPFTAKASSVAPLLDILKQGRCTLVTTVQMFKILGLLCLSTAYALSVMYLQGVKLSDTQATLSGVLTAGMFFFISNAKPLEQLSPTRPHPSIFNLYFFGSLLGQFAAQLAFLVFMYRGAVAAMPKDEAQDSESDFKPNLVNSVCYLVEQTVQLTTFAVNYVGHPFNESLRENTGMRMSITYAGGFLLVLVLEVVPQLNESFSLVPIPADLRSSFIAGAVATALFCSGWERMLRTMVPARRPPARAYLEQQHRAELEAARAEAGAGKKRQ